MPLRFPIFLICAFWACQACSQNAQQLKQKGKIEFEQADYLSAIETFKSAKNLNPNDSEIQYLLGVSYYYNENPDLAKKELLSLSETCPDCSGLKKNPYKKLFFYLGKACQAKHEFTEAVRFYKGFLKHYNKKDRLRKEAKEDILRCAVGIKKMQNREKVVVENLGENVNSEFDDFAPIVSPNDANKLYFTSNRPGQESDTSEVSDSFFPNLNIFFTQTQNGKRKLPESLNDSLNSTADEVLWGFGEEGSEMYFFQGKFPYRGHHYRRELSNQLNQVLFEYEKFDSPHHFNIEQPHFGQKALVFSMRPGKFSHQDSDLYIAPILNGQRLLPKSYGEQINSNYNETSPFLSADGKTLYFSSDNPRKSMGGYDIFKSEFDEKTQTWSEPENLNFPVNSAGNDVNFRISKDGYSAYFSSDRMSGFGGKDIYSVHFSDSKIESNSENITTQKTDNQLIKGLFYQIEIRETNSERLEKLRSSFPNPNIEKTPNSETFRLVFGQYRTFQSANLLRKDLAQKGFVNIEINAIIDGKKVGIIEAERLVSEYPDLRFFLKKR